MTSTIVICMGSSCFARGNEQLLGVIEAFLAEHHLIDDVELVGTRCEGQCCHGPNIRINGILYQGVDCGTLVDLLEEQLGPMLEGKNG